MRAYDLINLVYTNNLQAFKAAIQGDPALVHAPIFDKEEDQLIRILEFIVGVLQHSDEHIKPFVEFLIAQGAKLDATVDGKNLIACAAGYVGTSDRPLTVQLLIAAGVDPFAITPDGWNAHGIALDWKRALTAKVLKDLGVPVVRPPQAGTEPGFLWRRLQEEVNRVLATVHRPSAPAVAPRRDGVNNG
jgi:hypothetical protein